MRQPFLRETPDLWEWDGSLRDVYVRGVSEADWLAFFHLVAQHQFVYSADGKKKKLPEPSIIFADRSVCHLLSINVNGVRINCHFFVPGEIELDIDPRDVTRESQHSLVLEFLQTLARGLSKAVAITAQNAPDALYLSYNPEIGQWRKHPPGSWSVE